MLRRMPSAVISLPIRWADWCAAFCRTPWRTIQKAGRFVDKLFTHATPHNGIDMAGTNVPVTDKRYT